MSIENIRKNFIFLFLSNPFIRIVNLITLYRLFICILLGYLIEINSPYFKWVLLSAFITDVVDGYLARRWKVTSKVGARLDSAADDLLFITCIISLFYFHLLFLMQYSYIIIPVLLFFGIKFLLLICKHNRIVSGMHTYLTKASAFLQALFFITTAFWGPSDILFLIAIFSTIIAIIEEIVIIIISKRLKENTKGLFFKTTL